MVTTSFKGAKLCCEDHKMLKNGYATKLGISSLKSFQMEAIKAYIDRKDSVVIQPTSSRKSAYFQVPAVMLESGQFVLVVCPTVSLMESQVHIMREKAISAVFLGASSEDDFDLYLLCKGQYDNDVPKLLYVTPEYLMGDSSNDREGVYKKFFTAQSEKHSSC